MNLHGLRLFHAIVRYGGVTRAAEELNISQPAVSSQVKRFEREIGIQLFVSEGRKLVLTDAGTQLITYAERLFMLEQEVEHFVEDMIQGRKGLIRLSATYLPSNFLLPSWIARFKQAHEDVEIIVSTSNTQMAFDQLLRYEAEIAIYGGSGVSHPGYIGISCLKMKCGLWCIRTMLMRAKRFRCIRWWPSHLLCVSKAVQPANG